MRNLNELNKYRVIRPDIITAYGSAGDDTCGMFELPSVVTGQTLRVIAANGGGWDHVSVSLQFRVPLWDEMEYVKRLFFKDDETAMQLHLPVKDHINCHPFCLHLWRPHKKKIPLPPSEYV